MYPKPKPHAPEDGALPGDASGGAAAGTSTEANVTSGAGHAEPVVDESAPPKVAEAKPVETPVETAVTTAAAQEKKAAEPPAQAGDDVEVKVAEAKPVVKLPTEEEARAELAANPARTSVLSQVGHIVREG